MCPHAQIDYGQGANRQQPAAHCETDAALFDSISRDSYSELRDYILRNGAKRVLDMFASSRQHKSKLCPPGLELLMVVQGGFMGAVGPLLSRDGIPGTGVELSEMDMIQFAISQKAFHVAMLLLICGCDSSSHHKCCLTLYHPTEIMTAPVPPLTKKLSAEVRTKMGCSRIPRTARTTRR